jgi:transposase
MPRSRPRPRHHSRRAKLPPELRTVNLNAAGVDVGADRHFVAVPEGRDPEDHTVRSFGAFTPDLHALTTWLRECGVETVAMESTGVYWIPLFELLVEQGFDVKTGRPTPDEERPRPQE